MVMKRYDSVAAYIAGQPKAAQASLRQMRATIRKAVPAAVEGMSYGIPGYKLNGRVLLYFAAWKQHYAVYPATAGVQAACQRELARCRSEQSPTRAHLILSHRTKIPLFFL